MYRRPASTGLYLPRLRLSGLGIFLGDIHICLPRIEYYSPVCKQLSVAEVDWNLSLGRVRNDLF